tara:strand:- start:500 stop:2074 length:1575 start_codon:yes stop_codon:yes gene_type:complete
MRQTAESLPVITQWQGMPLRPIGDSMHSISASSYKWEILDGIREIPYSMFSNTSISARNSRETAYLQDLARQIQENQSIEPLIVVFDDDPSPYILEGVHRFDALHHMMGAQTLPAMVVLDWTPGMQYDYQETVSSSRERLTRVSQQGIRYEWVDPDGDYDEQSYELARNSSINILSDKEPSMVAVSGDRVVGALFTSVQGNSYSFDVVVDPSFQRQGIGGRLTDMAMSHYKDMSADMPDLEMNADVVNPVMKNMLQDRGLSEKSRIDDQRSIMGRGFRGLFARAQVPDQQVLVWKHHIAEDFEQDPSLLYDNGVGSGGTVFTDFGKMVNWLSGNDKRRFYVVPIVMNSKDLEFDPSIPFMATSRIEQKSPYRFAPIEEWAEADISALQPQSEPQVDLYARLQQLLPQLASAAQNEYNQWDQDEDGMDMELGAGGICQEIASAFCDILSSADISCTTFDAQIGDQHVWAVAYDDQEAFSVDIPPSVYETGTGYVWQKIPNVVFGPDDIVLERVRLEDVQASEGLY